MDDIVERLRQYNPLTCSACDNWAKCGYGEPCDCACHTQPCLEAAEEIDRLRREAAELRWVVRAHEGMYDRAAEEINRLRGWLERTYRMAVGHGPDWRVFDSWEEAINAYEEARRG